MLNFERSKLFTERRSMGIYYYYYYIKRLYSQKVFKI